MTWRAERRREPGAQYIDTVYTPRYHGCLESEIQFDWDDANLAHLKRHGVSPEEFEQVIANDPLDLEYELESGEERYKSLGATDRGRILIAVWTARRGKIRGITAYPAGPAARKLYLESRR